MPRGQSLKVGLVFDDSLDSDDGVAQYVKRVGSWLSSQGHEVVYFVGQTKKRSWAGGKVYSLAKNQSVNFNGNRLSIPLPADKERIKQVLDQENPDILHVMMPYSPFMAQKIINSANENTAIVGTFHIYPSGNLSIIGSKILKHLYRKSLKKFDEVTSVSDAAGSFAKNIFGINTTVVPNPIDIASFSTGKSIKNRDEFKKIIFLGRLVKRKGCRQLLEAFALLSEKNPDTRLVIAGNGADKPKLEKIAKRLDLGDKVNFLGYIDESEKPVLLAQADIACFPSLYGESFGIVLIEAMASGARTVLGGNNPGYSSVLHKQPKLLIDPNNKTAFADRMQELLKDRILADRIQEWQQSEVKQYDINVVGSKLENIYYSVIARLAKKDHNNAHG